MRIGATPGIHVSRNDVTASVTGRDGHVSGDPRITAIAHHVLAQMELVAAERREASQVAGVADRGKTVTLRRHRDVHLGCSFGRVQRALVDGTGSFVRERAAHHGARAARICRVKEFELGSTAGVKLLPLISNQRLMTLG